MLAKREEWTQALYDIVRQIATAPTTESLLKSIKECLNRLFSGKFDIIIKQINNGLILDKPIPLITDEKEKSAAIWVFETGKEAGWSTTTLPSTQIYTYPLKVLMKRWGY